MSPDRPNPFRGLEPYTRADAKGFFGRDDELILVRERLFHRTTTLLFAPSGAGKTSFLLAKLLPRLEEDFFVAYHGGWTDKAPVDSIRTSLSDARQRFEAAREAANAGAGQSGDRRTGAADGLARCLEGLVSPTAILVLDQFEEFLQYHAYRAGFADVLGALRELARTPWLKVRLVFSMREEFLGELTGAERFFPGIFANYYRLSHPTPDAARRIVRFTCLLAGVEPPAEGVAGLVADLAQVGAPGTAGPAGASDSGSREGGYVELPHLQIVCQGLWNQAPGTRFLGAYKTGDTAVELRAFLDRRMSALSSPERSIAARVLDHLVTRRGAKMAYEMESLARHLRRPYRWFGESLKRRFRTRLRTTLEKLSRPPVRILRRTEKPNGAIWYELYHDRFGPFLHDWKERYQASRRRLAGRCAIGAALALLLLVLGVVYAVILPRSHRQTLRSGTEDYRLALEAYESLRTLGFRGRAEQALADYWSQRSLKAQLAEDRDGALLAALESLNIEPTERRRRAVGELVGQDFPALQATIRLPSAATALVLSDDGRWLATGEDDGSVQLFELAGSDSPSKRLLGRGDTPVTELRFSRSKRWLAARGADAAVGLWDLQEPASDPASDSHLEGRFTSFAFDPQERWIALADAGGTVRLRPLEPGRKEHVLSGPIHPAGRVTALAFSPRGQRLAVGRRRGDLDLYELAAPGSEARTLSAHEASVTGVVFSGESTLWTSRSDRAVRRFDLSTPALDPRDYDHASGISSLVAAPNGLVVSGSYDKTARVWDSNSDDPPLILGGHEGGVRAMAVAPDGRYLAVMGGDGITRVWDLQNPSALPRLLRGQLGAVTAARNGLVATIDGRGGAVRLWNVEPRRPPTLERKFVADAPLGKVVLSGDGRRLAASAEEGIWLWRVDRPEEPVILREQGPSTLVTSRGGQWLASVDITGNVRLWNLDSDDVRSSVRQLPVNQPSMHVLAFGADGHLLAGGDLDGRVFLWHLNDEKAPTKLAAGGPAISAVTVGPRGRWLAAAVQGLHVLLWDLKADASRPQKLDTGGLSVTSLALAPTGRWLVGHADRRVILWDLSAETAAARSVTLQRHAVSISALAVDAGGARLATLDRGGAGWLWDLAATDPPAAARALPLVGGTVARLTFGRGGDELFATTAQWLHRVRLRAPARATGSLLLPGSGAEVLLAHGPEADAALVVSPLAGHALALRILDFDQPPAAPLEGEPEVLLRSWQRRLALQLDSAGRLRPIVSMPGGSQG